MVVDNTVAYHHSDNTGANKSIFDNYMYNCPHRSWFLIRYASYIHIRSMGYIHFWNIIWKKRLLRWKTLIMITRVSYVKICKTFRSSCYTPYIINQTIWGPLSHPMTYYNISETTFFNIKFANTKDLPKYLFLLTPNRSNPDRWRNQRGCDVKRWLIVNNIYWILQDLNNITLFQCMYMKNHIV